MMDKEGTSKNRRSNGTKQDPISWMNGLPHPETGELLQGARWSPVTGCSGEQLPCRPRCWARRLAVGRMALNHRFPPDVADAYARFAPTFHPNRLGHPLRFRTPQAFFTCGMGDMFDEQITNEQIAAIFGVMAACHEHLFITLTKRAERAVDWHKWILTQWSECFVGDPPEDQDVDANVVLQFVPGEHEEGHQCPTCPGACRVVGDIFPPPWPLPNVWLGTSVSTQYEADTRIPLLLQIPAAFHLVSVEPMLGPIDLTRTCLDRNADPAIWGPGRLKWVICGGETQPGARPCDPAWVRDLRDQCIRARVPFHFKGWGTGGELRGRELDGRTWEQVP